MNHVTLKLFKLHPDVPTPTYGTSFAACFDLTFHPHGKWHVDGYNVSNAKVEFPINGGFVTINQGERILFPTGLIARMETPDNIANYSIRIHGRSGLALKNGIILANCEGVVDADYGHEIFVMLTNISDRPQHIRVGDRIAQAEIVKNEIAVFVETTEMFRPLSERNGGFGSTGVNRADTVDYVRKDLV